MGVTGGGALVVAVACFLFGDDHQAPPPEAEESREASRIMNKSTVLPTCRSCNASIQPKTRRCPRCGWPVKKTIYRNAIMLSTVIGMVLGGTVCGFVGYVALAIAGDVSTFLWLLGGGITIGGFIGATIGVAFGSEGVEA